MIEILTDTATVGQKVKDYIQRRILARGYCSVDYAARLNGVLSVHVPGIGWPLHRLGWVEMPEITFRKDSYEDFWRIQLDDPVRLDIFKTVEDFREAKNYDVKPIHKEDKQMSSATFFEEFMAKFLGYIPGEIQDQYRKRVEAAFTPKSIEQSADHKTVCVLWQDGSKTIVKLSENDKDDIDTAFAYALAKKIFGTNTHLKKVVRQQLNEHKPKIKKLPSDPNQEEPPSDPDPKEITENG